MPGPRVSLPSFLLLALLAGMALLPATAAAESKAVPLTPRLVASPALTPTPYRSIVSTGPLTRIYDR
jgi:hypothetical protein